MKVPVRLLFAFLGLCMGCSPTWHSGDEKYAVWHTVRKAAVYDDSLSIQGVIKPIHSFTDYGVRVNTALDDTGKELTFRGYQLFWAKELCFEIELAAPDKAAHTVYLDIEFLTRSGKQVLKRTIRVERDVKPDYATQLDAWKSAKPVQP